MGLARAHAIALVGVQGHAVEIEVDIENGMVALLLVGLPDTALREARDRIRSAIVNSGEAWPTRRITVGLSPASLPKRGSGFDLGIAMAILAAAGSVPAAALCGLVLIGELGLDGRVRPVPGVLPAAAAAAAAGFGAIAVAAENAAEAALVPQLRVIAAPSLSALTAFIRAGSRPGESGVRVLEPGRDIGAFCGAGQPGESAGQAPPGADRACEARRAGSPVTAELAIAGDDYPHGSSACSVVPCPDRLSMVRSRLLRFRFSRVRALSGVWAASSGPLLERMVNRHRTSAGSPHRLVPSWSR